MAEWLEGLKGGAPTVVGAVIGSLLGFVTLVLGALFNAYLNRRRDDELRRTEAKGVAAAIRAELQSLEEILTYNAQKLRDDPPGGSESFFLPDLSHSVRMFPVLTSKTGLLGDPAIIMEVIQAYIVVDQYCENCLVLGGTLGSGMPNHRRMIVMPSNRAQSVAAMNLEIADRVGKAMRLLDRFLI
jgi:hypothetical protein